MTKRWFSFMHACCDKCGGPLEVKSFESFRFSLADEIKCLECPAVGILVGDDSDRDSISIQWAS